MDAWNLITCDKSAVVSNGKTCKVLIPCVKRMGWIKGSLAESHDFKGEHLHVITSFCPAAVHFLIIQIALKKNVGELLRYGRRFACLHLFFFVRLWGRPFCLRCSLPSSSTTERRSVGWVCRQSMTLQHCQLVAYFEPRLLDFFFLFSRPIIKASRPSQFFFYFLQKLGKEITKVP